MAESNSQILPHVLSEFRKTKAMADRAVAQLEDADLFVKINPRQNSIAAIIRHLAGNMLSRFTDFLTTDGEKPWRRREEEFAARHVTRAELMEKWNKGWGALLATLPQLTDADLSKSVTIRGQSLLVHEALHRSLAHTCYHVGQIVYVAHAIRGRDWRYLSIPPGQSDSYNANPTAETAQAHAKHLEEGT